MPQLRVLRSSKISCDGDGEAVNIGYTRSIQFSLCGGHRLTLPWLGFRSPCCFWLLVLRDRSACMYCLGETYNNAASRYLSDRRGRHNGKLTRTCNPRPATQCLAVKTRLSISDSGAHKCDVHHKKPRECDGRHKKPHARSA